MRNLLAVMAVALLVGCATQAKFQAKMDGFVGQPEDVLVSVYGPPQNIYVLNDRSKVIQYARSRMVVLPGATSYQPLTTNTVGNMTLNQGLRTTTGTYNQTSTTYVQQQGPSIPVNLTCTVNFTIDKEGIVRRWSADGNHCVSQ